MATVAQTVETAPTPGKQVKVLKFEAFNCKTAGETTDTIEAAGYDYAVVYAVQNTVTTPGAGSGHANLRAVLPDDSAVAGILGGEDETANQGYLNREVAALLTAPNSVVGSRVGMLPDKFTIVHDGGNSGATAYTIDLYVELHRAQTAN